MRIPSLPSFVRTFYAFSNATFHRTAPTPFSISAARPGVVLRSSMPTIPLLGSFFHTAESRKMSHPVQKTDEEWQMQLNKGESATLTSLHYALWTGLTLDRQSNSASSVKKAPKRPFLANTTSTPLLPEHTPVQVATHPSTLPSTSSSLVADGLPSSMPFLAP